MVKVLIAIICFLPILLNAQGFGSFTFDQPYLAKDVTQSTTPTLPAGLAFLWDANDLSNSPVAAWPDQIQSRYLVQPTGANQPTWATNGVSFVYASAQWLQLTNTIAINTGGSEAYLVVASTKAGALDTYMILGTATGTGGYTSINWNGNWFLESTGLFDPPDNKPYEFLFAGVTPGVYTNGVACGAAGSANQNNTLDYVGSEAGSSLYYNGTINLIAIWTNVVGFDAASIAQIHRYCTNKFDFLQ